MGDNVLFFLSVGYMWDLQLFKPNLDDLEVDAVSEVVADGWPTMGERASELKEQFSEFLGIYS